MNLSRRALIGSIGASTVGVIAGCVDAETESKSGAGSGAHLDYEKAVNTVDGMTYVDLSFESWYDCSGISASPTKTVFVIELVAAGETHTTDEWVVDFEDCMNSHSTDRSYQLSDEYEEVVVHTTTEE